MIKTIIIDDEHRAVKTLQSYIYKYTPDVRIIGVGTSKKEAIDLISNTEDFDLLLLDINLGDGTAFEVLEQIGSKKFHVIFTTAYDQHAVKAFKYSALDYLLKPLDPEEFMDAVEKLRTKDKSSFKNQLELATSIKESHTINKMVVNSSNEIHFIAIDKIIRLEAEKNYTDIYFADGEKITSSKTLKYYEDLLPLHIFYRIHQKHLVNIYFIKKFLKEDGGYVLLTDQSKLAVSRRKKEGLLNILTS